MLMQDGKDATMETSVTSDDGGIFYFIFGVYCW